MKNSSEVQKLKGKITKERGSNWSVNYEKGKYRGISPENGSTFYLCSIPLMFSSKTLSGALVWSSSSKRYTQVSLLDQSAGRNPKDFSEITYTYGDGNVVTNTDVFEAEVNTQESSGGADTDDNIVPPGGGGICYRCGCQEVVTENCTDYNISCIAIMAGSLGISCNPFTGYVACFLGTTFTGILPWVTGDNCNICDNYDVDRTKVGYACEYDSAP